MRRGRIIMSFGSALLLAGCGAVQGLAPVPGKALPIKPAMSPTQPTPDQLLATSPTVRPGRSDELLTKSQARREDRFDLPPH